jgi:hypothetical protein
LSYSKIAIFGINYGMKFILEKEIILRENMLDRNLAYSYFDMFIRFFLVLMRNGERDKSRREGDRSTDLP